MTQAVKNVNSIVLVFAILLIGFVIVQATIFLRHALKFNAKHELFSKDEIKDAVQASAISSIGPSFSIVVIVLAMISLIGPAVTWMRSGVLGSADYELWIADIVSTQLGVTLGGEGFTEAAFTVAIFGMVLASAPFMVNCLITIKPLDKAMMKAAKKKNSFIPLLGMTAELGMMGYWALENGTKGVPNTIAIIASLLTAMAVVTWCKKGDHPKLSNWILAIALIAGMFVATVVQQVIG